MVKICTIRGHTGCKKYWCVHHILLHYYVKGLFGIATHVVSRRLVFLGSKHIDHIFCLTFDKNSMSPYKIAEFAIAKLNRHPEKINLLKILDVLFFDKIGQLHAELFSAIEIMLRRARQSTVFMGEVIIISAICHTQLQPVNGRPFLFSTHAITCFMEIKTFNDYKKLLE